MKTNTQTDRLVRGQFRFRRRALPLAVAAAGLAVTLLGVWLAHPSLQPVAHWNGLRAGWIAGLTATVCLAAFAWWRRHRQNLLRSAAELDSEFTTMNRLETAVAEQADDSPLARAQRAETERVSAADKGFIASPLGADPRRRGLAPDGGACGDVRLLVGGHKEGQAGRRGGKRRGAEAEGGRSPRRSEP